MSTTEEHATDRQRRIRRNTLWLTLLALAFYAVFIALSVRRAHG